MNALGQHPDAQDPATVIGPEFARTCGIAADLAKRGVFALIAHAL
ncbi:hypothetical protein ACFL2S_11690 [Thermodesulfobacteriota bacterium]